MIVRVGDREGEGKDDSEDGESNKQWVGELHSSRINKQSLVRLVE